MALQKIYHLVGEQTVPIYLSAIQFDNALEHCLIATENPRVRGAAEHICSELKRNGYKATIQSLGQNEIACDFKKLNRTLAEFLNPASRQCECAINVTGGTKPMAFTALLQAKNNGIRAFYLDSMKTRSLVWLDNLNEQPIEKWLTIDNFMGLAGMRVMPNAPRVEGEAIDALDSQAWWKRETLIRYQENFADLLHRTDRKGEFTEIYQELCSAIKDRFGSNCADEWNDAFDKAFSRRSWLEQCTYLAGGWLENYVHSLVVHQPGVRECRLNVQVTWPGEEKAAQEFDVVYTDGLEMVILECKAGCITQDHFNKLEKLRDNYSGALGRSAIVTLCASDTNNNQRINFVARVKESKKIAAFCGDGGIRQLPKKIFSFKNGEIYE